jgi:hypothetical protein
LLHELKWAGHRHDVFPMVCDYVSFKRLL